MLSETQIIQNKVEYIKLLSKLDVDLTRFTSYLDGPRVDFYKKPYNNYPESSYYGSLCEHCLKLYNNLVTICNLYCPNKYSEKDLIKVALLKDIYRAELYEPYVKRAVNNDTGQWEGQLAFKMKDDNARPIFGDIGFSSYMIAKKFFNDLSDEVVEAICFSSLSSCNSVDINNIRTSYPLTVLVTLAEIATKYLPSISTTEGEDIA